MENQLENKVSMYLKVDTMLSANVAATASVPLIASTKLIFNTKLTSLLTKIGVADMDITGSTVDKQNKRVALTKTGILISRALVLHGTATANTFLIEKFDNSPSTFNLYRDSDLYTHCTSIRDTATPLVALLTGYLVTPTVLTQFNTEMAAYLAVIENPRDQISIQGVVREEAYKLVEEIDIILNGTMDVAIGLFQFSNPSLYTLYQNARSIDGTGAAQAPNYEGTAAPASITAVANIPYLPSRTFIVKNTGNVPLTLSLSTVNNAIEGTSVTVAPGAQVQRQSANFNMAASASFLLLQNVDVAQACGYKIWIEE